MEDFEKQQKETTSCMRHYLIEHLYEIIETTKRNYKRLCITWVVHINPYRKQQKETTSLRVLVPEAIW